MNKLKTNIVIFSLLAMIFGTLFHFTYSWFKGPVFYLISATDESVFSHLKLIFWPMLFLGVIEYFVYGKKYQKFLYSKIIAITIAMLVIVNVYYTVLGATGKNFAFINIPLFFVAVGLAYYYTYKSLLNPKKVSLIAQIISYAWLCVLLFSFVFFTYHPLNISLFME